MRKIIALLFFLLFAFGVIFVLMQEEQWKNELPQVDNFEECAAAGYPVMESYPRQCTGPGNHIFVEQVVPEK